MEINQIEVSPNNRASCRVCHNKIKEGTPRGVEVAHSDKYGIYYKYYCYKCTGKVINQQIDNLKANIKKSEELGEELKNKKEECKKTLIAEEL